MRDIAAAAKVSIATVSIALSRRMGTARISESCIQRVRAVATELGYLENYHAKALKEGRSRTIGLMIGGSGPSYIGNQYWGRIASGLEFAARSAGYDVLMVGGTQHSDPVQRTLNLIMSGRIDGVVVPVNLYGGMPLAFQQIKAPIVQLFREDLQLRPRVLFHDTPGIVAAVCHLAELGHHRIAWLGYEGLTSRHARYQNRVRAFQGACARLGIAAEHVIMEELPEHYAIYGHSVEAYLNTMRPLPIRADVTAVLCMNDACALALLHLLGERGLSCPADLSIIGFDHLYADITPRPLTTISHRLDEIGAAAAAMLVRNIEDPEAALPDEEISIPSSFVPGVTTGPARTRER